MNYYQKEKKKEKEVTLKERFKKIFWNTKELVRRVREREKRIRVH